MYRRMNAGSTLRPWCRRPSLFVDTTCSATQQRAMIPLTLLPEGKSADYVLAGAWGGKAIGEAKTIAAVGGGAPKLAGRTGTGEGKDKSYVRVPRQSELKLDGEAAYLH